MWSHYVGKTAPVLRGIALKLSGVTEGRSGKVGSRLKTIAFYQIVTAAA